MIVAIIGPNDHHRSAFLAMRTWEVLTKLVTRESARVFLFNNGGQFDRDCWEIVAQLKSRMPEIEMHYYHGVFDYDVGYVSYMKESYDKVFFPEKGIPLKGYLRDRQMIDECDVLVTYYYDLQLEEEPKSSAVLAVEYAQSKKKKIINMYDLLFEYKPF